MVTAGRTPVQPTSSFLTIEESLWLVLPISVAACLFLREDSSSEVERYYQRLRPISRVCVASCVIFKFIFKLKFKFKLGWYCSATRWWAAAWAPTSTDSDDTPTSSAPSSSSATVGLFMGATLIPSLLLAMAMVDAQHYKDGTHHLDENGAATPLQEYWTLQYAIWTSFSSSITLLVLSLFEPLLVSSSRGLLYQQHTRWQAVLAIVCAGVVATPVGALLCIRTLLLPDDHIACSTFLACWILTHYFLGTTCPVNDHQDYDHYLLITTNSYVKNTLSWGELQVLIGLIIMGFHDWLHCTLEGLYDHSVYDDGQNHSGVAWWYVAQSGVAGCLLMAWIPLKMAPQVWRHGLPLLVQVILQVVGPLVAVEGSLWYQAVTREGSPYAGHPQDPNIPYLPRCFNWLVRFLMTPEGGYPRYWGLVYWGVSLAVLSPPTLYLLGHQQDQISSLSVVMARKWFHFVAVVLFAPMTVQFPQLLGLSYAIALCGLIVLETIRIGSHDPTAASPISNSRSWLQSFYHAFLDPSKDQGEGMILSHLCLILGCALPLWISQILLEKERHQEEVTLGDTISWLLPQWGILCLGVGDAMGALIGKGYGRIRWGHNHRTVEGSVAMWVSMIVVGGIYVVVLVPFGQWHNAWAGLVGATTFTTLLEAHTCQMDNLVLPLAGATVIILLSLTAAT